MTPKSRIGIWVWWRLHARIRRFEKWWTVELRGNDMPLGYFTNKATAKKFGRAYRAYLRGERARPASNAEEFMG